MNSGPLRPMPSHSQSGHHRSPIQRFNGLSKLGSKTACVRCVHVGQRRSVGSCLNHATVRAANEAASRANRTVEAITAG